MRGKPFGNFLPLHIIGVENRHCLFSIFFEIDNINSKDITCKCLKSRLFLGLI